jgi:hypothetical protein
MAASSVAIALNVAFRAIATPLTVHAALPPARRFSPTHLLVSVSRQGLPNAQT